MDHGPASSPSPVKPRVEPSPAVAASPSWVPAYWPLILVLILQAALSARLLRADTAFEDEAAYLWAGHLEWANLLHGTPLPQFPSYFSGAPVIYPPLAALADSVGGLVAARLLSLVFMLGATTLLYFTARRLAGPWAAFFGPAKLPKEIVNRVNREVNAIIKRPDVREQIAHQSFELQGSTPEELAAFTREQLEAWKTGVREAGLPRE